MLERVVLKYLKLILGMKKTHPILLFIEKQGFVLFTLIFIAAWSLSGQLSSQAHFLNYPTVCILQVIVYIEKKTAIIILNG